MTEQYANQLAPTILTVDLAQGGDTATVLDPAGFPTSGTFRVILGQGAGAEIVTASGVSGTSLAGLVRAQEGTTDTDWPEGTPVAHVLTAASYAAGITDRIATHSAAGDPHPAYATDTDLGAHEADSDAHPGYLKDADITGAIDTHEAAGDPHPTYLTSAEGDAKVSTHANASDPHPNYATDTDLANHVAAGDPHTGYATDADLSAHNSASDPHTGYQKESEKGSANGYAGLDGTGTVPDAQLPSTLARDSEVTSAVATHAAQSDPHSAYATDNDLAAHTAAVDPHTNYASDSDLTTHANASDPHTGYQKESEKGNASGYASLDSGGTVPDAQIPSLITRDSELASHEADTTAIHGISDTSALETTTGSAAKITTHEAAVNPHPTYETSAEAQAKVDTHAAAADPHPTYDTSAESQSKVDTHAAATAAHPASKVSFSPVGTIASTDVQAAIAEVAVEAGSSSHPDLATHDSLGLATDAELSTHVAAADPHTGYQKESEKGNASGYASLDGSGFVPDAQIAGTIARDAEVTTAVNSGVATHEAAANPHPTYETSAEAQAKVDTHVDDTSDAHDASAVSFVPTGTIAATDTQTAVAEVATDAASALSTHTAANTSVHGIAVTANLETVSGSQAKVDTHAAAADPHPQYDQSAEAAAKVTAHEAASDPHPTYMTSAETDTTVATHTALPNAHHAQSHAHDGADGSGTVSHANLTSVSANQHHNQAHAINGADHTGTLDDSQIPAAIARDTEVTAAVTTHEAAANPHAVYATDADLTAHAAAADPHTVYMTSAETDSTVATHAALPNVHHAEAHSISGAAHTGTLAYSSLSGTPSTFAPADHGASAHTDISRSFWIDVPAMVNNLTTPNNSSFSASGTQPDIYHRALLNDGVTTGFYFKVPVPLDWASGPVTYKVYWVPTATNSGTVRWSIDALDVAAGGTASTVVTPTAYTGDSGSRTANQLVIESAQTLVTPSAAGNVIRCALQRVGTDGADTYVGNVAVIGIQILYLAVQ